MKLRISTFLLLVTIWTFGQTFADDLSETLGLNKRVGFRVASRNLTSISYGQPIETIAVPEALLIPLQAMNEGLTFYAAYCEKNYGAMAAVGAMSPWGGTLRRGIDAVTNANAKTFVSVEDLVDLTDRELLVLSYLWHTDGRSGRDLYREVRAKGTWEDLSRELEGMEKRKLIEKVRDGSRILYMSVATPHDVRRAALISRSPRESRLCSERSGTQIPI